MTMPRDTALAEMDALSDDALLLLYGRGDAEAARLLTARHLGRVYGFAARLLGDRAEAEDVAQEAMLRLWRAAGVWRAGEAQLSSWLYRVTVNLCTDRQRSRARRRAEALDDVAEPADDRADTEAALLSRERADALQSALATLPDRQRQAVVLRHIEGLSNPEIAAILEVGVEAVESLTARGKRALTAALAGRKAALGL
ncbi:RNA polymerase sigma factor [Tabrizicola oligotrophica]|uniref:RNA polymerase sigma factor n=1 Tax=Tabrizicola oligotrophica TaxID=2710650 RepID=A0A6M0QWM1_9RHOB|nr:RNA polymerase sigma factor [Tabrizicola oligotrophica]NEY91888.1 RNA polymerase sigma factor [Tabrizicola oligotrophica]